MLDRRTVAQTPSQLDLPPPKRWRRLVPPWLRSLIWVDAVARYDAFLSYSWASDSEVAPVIQSVLQRFLCPWYKVRARTVFRDLSCLPAGSNLEKELFDRLERAVHLIVLASPAAAQSGGMEMEARHWFGRERNGEVIVIITAGECRTWEDMRDHLLPAAVRDNLPSEPLWIPLEGRRAQILSNPKDRKLRDELVEDLAQVFLRLYPGYTWEQLRGEERSQRRRAVALLSSFTLLLLALTIFAFYERNLAERSLKQAESRRLAAESELNLPSDPLKARDLAIQAVHESKTDQALQAVYKVLT